MKRYSEHLSRLHPDHFRIAHAAVWVGLFTVAAKFVAAGKEIAIAWRYGRGPEVDAYNLALTLTTWLPSTLVGIMTMVLVPALAGMSANLAMRQRFIAELKGLAGWCSLASLFFVVLFSFVGLPWYASNLDTATFELARQMMVSLSPLAALTIVVGVAVVQMQAHHDHAYALADAVPALCVLVMIWAWQSMDSWPLVAGTVLGVTLQALWLSSRSRRLCGAVGVGWRPLASEWPLLWRSAAVMGLGQFAMSLVTLIDQYFATWLGSGAVATLGYANRLIALGMALGATMVSRAMLAILSEAVTVDERTRAGHLARQWSLIAGIGGLVAAALCYWVAPHLVQLLYLRGSFDQHDALAVTEVLRSGVWQWPFYLGGLVLVQFLAASGLYYQIAISGLLAVAGKALLNMLLVGPFGVPGIVLGSALMYALTLLWFVWCVRNVN